MGFHAVISAGVNEYGNARHRVAPRVKASPRVTGVAVLQKFHALAGPVLGFSGLSPDISESTMEFAYRLNSRKITALTTTFAQYHKASPTQWELNVRELGMRVIVRKVATKAFNGWVASGVTYAGESLALGSVAKGQSIETNGERADCCRMALNRLQGLLISLPDVNPQAIPPVAPETPSRAVQGTPTGIETTPDVYEEGYVLDVLSGADEDSQEYGLDWMTDDSEETLFLVIDNEKLTVTKVPGGYTMTWG